MKTGKILLGVLAGVAAGALLGVLLAPDKGSDTLKKISNKSKGYADDVKEKFNDLIDGMSDKIDVVKNKANDFVSNGKAKVDEYKVS